MKIVNLLRTYIPEYGELTPKKRPYDRPDMNFGEKATKPPKKKVKLGSLISEPVIFYPLLSKTCGKWHKSHNNLKENEEELTNIEQKPCKLNMQRTARGRFGNNRGRNNQNHGRFDENRGRNNQNHGRNPQNPERFESRARYTQTRLPFHQTQGRMYQNQLLHNPYASHPQSSWRQTTLNFEVAIGHRKIEIMDFYWRVDDATIALFKAKVWYYNDDGTKVMGHVVDDFDVETLRKYNPLEVAKWIVKFMPYKIHPMICEPSLIWDFSAINWQEEHELYNIHHTAFMQQEEMERLLKMSRGYLRQPEKFARPHGRATPWTKRQPYRAKKRRFPPNMKGRRDYKRNNRGPDPPDSRMILVKKIQMNEAKLYAKISHDDSYELAITDSGSDTIGIGGKAWIIDHITNRKVQVSGYHRKDTLTSDVPIGSGITAVDLPNSETVLIRANEATLLGEDANTLLSTIQMRDHGIIIDDKATRHGGLSCIDAFGTIIPMFLNEGMMCIKIRKPTELEMESCEVIDITSPLPWDPSGITDVDNDMTEQSYELLLNEIDSRKLNMKKHRHVIQDSRELEPFFLFPGERVMNETIKSTVQLGVLDKRIPMRQHMKSRNPILQRRRINEDYASDSIFATVTSYEGYNGAQGFYGIKSNYMSLYGFTTESEGANCLLDFFRKEGVPFSITTDNSKMQMSKHWKEHLQRFWVDDKQIEPLRPQQNPFERAFGKLKEKVDKLFIDTGCDPRAWYKAMCHVADVMNCTARKRLDYRTPTERRDGQTPDITALIQFKFWEIVLYQRGVTHFPETGGSEALGHWCGRALNYGDKMCYWILDCESEKFVVRSMVRKATDERSNAAYLENIQEINNTTNNAKNQQNKSPIIQEKGEQNDHNYSRSTWKSYCE